VRARAGARVFAWRRGGDVAAALSRDLGRAGWGWAAKLGATLRPASDLT
jgi:hypothetical protein